MSITTDILSLRRDRSSSVETLLALIGWEHQAWTRNHKMSRHYAVEQAADVVLMNVAAHAAEADKYLTAPDSAGPESRAVAGTRKRRRTGPGVYFQRLLRKHQPC